MTAMTHTPQHRVSRVVASERAEVGELADASLWSMGPAEAAETLVELTRLGAQVTELTLRVAAHAETVRVGEATGAVSTGAWWAHQTRQTRSAAARSMHLAAALAGPRTLVRVALAAGDLNLDQAEVIVRAVDALPSDLVTDDIRAEVEAHLIGHAGEYDAKALRVLGKRALDVIAPEIGEAHENRVLGREEAQALAAARFTMTDDGHGKT
ncbi:DUF222 domain-containing protein, partial [Nocardioides sp.]|uniref:DUF222 domain-containing protein n=1 Tax=Nocardioides sp. TaxID=35761 RepID=UPI0031FF306B|nr:nuclease [Nocardioides sp.]